MMPVFSDFPIHRGIIPCPWYPHTGELVYWVDGFQGGLYCVNAALQPLKALEDTHRTVDGSDVWLLFGRGGGWIVDGTETANSHERTNERSR